MTHLKFRYWDKVTKAMYIADNIDIKDRRIGTYIDNEYMGSNFEDVVIMQSTGLTDKNEKEIFEGDIIQDDDDEAFRCVVEYVTASFILKGKNGRYQMSDLFPSDVVIGNIYENPKLFNS